MRSNVDDFLIFNQARRKLSFAKNICGKHCIIQRINGSCFLLHKLNKLATKKVLKRFLGSLEADSI